MHRTLFIWFIFLAMVVGSFGQQCGLNEEFRSCGSACEPNCSQPNLPTCQLICVVGCQCKDGYLRNGASDCVLPENC